MPIKILMPQLSPTMAEGNLVRWLKEEGDKVQSGDVIAEIETDKATMDVEAVDEGVLGKIVVAEGTEGVPVNSVIAVMLEEGEDPAALADVEAAPPPARMEAEEKPAAPEPAAHEPSPETADAPAPADEAVTEPRAAAPAEEVAPTARRGDGRVIASPLARRMAQQAGLLLEGIKGSGPGGRIVKADIEAALSMREAAPAPAPLPPPAAAVPPTAPFTEVPHTSMRKVIAQRLVEAKQTIPHFYLTIDCEIDELLKLRQDLNARSDAYKLTVNDFVIRAAALALKKVPAANAVWTEQALRRYTTVDVAVAVALEDGLITPIIRNADHKGLGEISNEMKELAARARKGALKPEEYQGGGFTVSNLGMYGIRQFEAVINPPQAGILAVGTGEQRPVVTDGALAVATVMTCSLSCDHRVIDGAIGAELLQTFKAFIQDPLTMLL
ncbi:MAG: pyruvate dehydrogenase complex dihydrolipoamide acetyltransferase [Alphaproteobacteria bacterium]